MSAEFKPLDLYNVQLDGTNLIEASAGTGKTFAISTLYIRLLLEKAWRVEDILVVTYTTAATAELNGRIRQKLQEFRSLFFNRNDDANVEDEDMLQYVRNYPNPNSAMQALDQAITDFDQACIDTIHGFCRKALQENAFESGRLFDTDLIQDHSDIVVDIIADFLRKNLYDSSKEFLWYAHHKLDADRLFRYVFDKLLFSDFRILPEPDKAHVSDELEKYYHKSRKKFAEQWSTSGREAAERLIKEDSKNLNSDEIERQLNSIDEFIKSTDIFPEIPQVLTVLAQKKEGAEYPIFNVAQKLILHRTNLESSFGTRLLNLKVQLLEYARDELQKRKDQKNVYFFDDLLLRLNAAITQTGAFLVEKLRNKYKAALIDEFQDTDTEQYLIFKKLFFHSSTVVFLIGDPKQAIYGFRGADIFSYIRAKKEAEKVFTLKTNYRSSPGLVNAVNTIFDFGSRPFIFNEIPFQPSHTAKDKSRNELMINGRLTSALRIWMLNSEELNEGKRIVVSKGRKWIARATASEISELLHLGRNGEARLGGETVCEKDIAVLVRSKFEGALVQAELNKLGIYAVVNTAASVFESREADELLRILRAIASPRSEGTLKGALATAIFGLTAAEILDLKEKEDDWENWFDAFNSYHRMWRDHGFATMFSELLRQQNVLQRLVTYSDGERRITNLLHLVELLNHASSAESLGMSGLIKWFTNRQLVRNKRVDEHQLRLESDENAVKILTMHISKGLQFPIVFAPFCWYGFAENSREILFHDEADNYRLTLDLGSKIHSENKLRFEKEKLAEDLRLSYVAVTRARNLCYLALGRFWGTGRNITNKSATAYLFHKPDSSLGSNFIDQLKKRYNALNDQGIREDVKKVCGTRDDSIEILDLPADEPKPGPAFEFDATRLKCRKLTTTIDSTHTIASYSSLVTRIPHGAELPDYDDIQESDAALKDERTQPNRFIDFPAGTKTGTFIHSVLEDLDFTTTDSDALNELIESKLLIFGFELEWKPIILDLIERVLNMSLADAGGPFNLEDISSTNRLNELEFYFPLKILTPKKLSDIFGMFDQPGENATFKEKIEELTFAPFQGFMKGFIDLVFERQGRYYILDWKSNYLGESFSDYNQTAMAKAMAESLYFLQYHIYTVALNQYLRHRIPDYEYDSHFGGVYYIFLRGLDADQTGCGIFYDRPEKQLITNLNQILLPDDA